MRAKRGSFGPDCLNKNGQLTKSKFQLNITKGANEMNFRGIKKKVLVCSVSLLTFFSFLAAAWADEPAPTAEAPAAPEAAKPSFSFSTDFLNQYIFRGAAQSYKSAVIQPSLAITYCGFTASVWGNFDTSRDSKNPLMTLAGQAINPAAPGQRVDNAKWSETDFTVSYTKELCPNFSINLGNIYYGLQQPISNYDEDELYGGVSYTLPWFTVAFTTYGEVTHHYDVWYELDLTRSIPVDCLCKGAVVDLGASFGYLMLLRDDNVLSLKGVPSFSPSPTSIAPSAVDLGSYSAFHTAELTADIKFPIGKYVTVGPKVALWLPLTDEASNYLDANSLDTKATHVVGGLNVTATF